MITYAQNFEDVLLARVFKHKREGFYIDVGAHDPNELSVTKYFHDSLGWRGINIEPNPARHQRFMELRPGDINLQIALADKPGSATLHVITGSTEYVADGSALSTLSSSLAKAAAEVMGGHPIKPTKVKVRTLAEVCAEHCAERQVDFLKIDVEGWEHQVLKGADFTQTRPLVLLLEATKPNVDFAGFDRIDQIAGWQAWEPLLLQADYQFAYFDGLNRFYVRAEDAEELLPFFSVPVGLYDGVEVSSPLWISSEIRRQIEESQNELSTALSERDSHLARFHSLESKLSAALSEHDSQAARIESLERQAAAMRIERDGELARYEASTRKITELGVALDETEQRLRTANTRLLDQSAERDTLARQLTTASAKLDDLEAQRLNIEEQLRLSKVQSADVTAERDTQLRRVRELTDELQAQATERDMLSKGVRKLNDELQAQYARHTTALQELEAAKDKNQSLAAQLEKGMELLNQSQQVQDESKQEYETLAKRSEAIGARLQKIERDLAGERAAAIALGVDKEEVETQLAVTQRMLGDRDSEVANLKNELAYAEERNRNLTDGLNAANERLALIRTMARENAYRRRHRLRLTILRWFPPFARLRYRVKDGALDDATLDDLLTPAPRGRRPAKSPQASSKADPKATSTVEGAPAAAAAPPRDITPPTRTGPLKISVITPSFNTGGAIERAILSVKAQDYGNYEHWIIDGGSTDETLDILKRYPHLKWVSEPDKGQSDAMNKGFAKAKGDIIVYLNADDEFLPGAFSAVIPAFEAGAKFVMGKVRVAQEKDGLIWENDPAVTFERILHHWEMNAFCVNPVGYFYRKEVQEQAPFNIENDDKMDLEFLLDVAAKFEMVKVDATLGTFHYAVKSKTGKEQVRLDYWQPENFAFVDRHAEALSAEDSQRYARARTIGYQQRRAWTINELVARDGIEEVHARDDVMTLPALGDEGAALLTDTDAVFFIMTGKSAADIDLAGFSQAFPPEIPIRHLQGASDIAKTRQFLADYGARLRPHVVAVSDTATAQGKAEAAGLLGRLFGQQIPKRHLKSVVDQVTFNFHRAQVVVVSAEHSGETLPTLAADWTGRTPNADA